ncbi:MAG TPA: S9 family peptidase [Candidatus Eisenbacteria bacterium]|jgi:dipeptidyl aminopeptidase/acylaminoacyl peptidase
MKCIPPICAALVLAATLAPPANAGSRPWTSDDLLALKTVSDPQLSPDGRSVAYVVSELNRDKSDYQTDVWLAPVAGGEARRLTGSPVADENPRWSPDGRTLAFLSERPRAGVKPDEAGKDADEGKRQAWLIRADGGEAWQLTDAKGGVSALEWSRDGARIAYLSKEPKSEERRKKEKDKDDAWTPSQMYPWNRLWVIEVATAKAVQLTSGELHVTGFSFSPDGKRLAIAAQPTPLIPDNFNSDIYQVPTAGGKPTPLVKRPGTDAQPRWSLDGKWIAFVSQDGRSTEWFTNNYICIVSPAGGPARNLTADFDERVEGLGAGGLEWSPDGSHLLFASNRHTSQQIYAAWTDGRPVEAVTRGPEMSSSPSVDAHGATVAFLRQDSEHPLEVWCMKTPEGAPRPVTDTNPQTRDMLSFRKEPVSWKGADGMTIEGLLIHPVATRSGQKVPLILNVHGGPAGTHSNTCTIASRLYPWALFAQKGYAILFPNPRGSGGYGAAFRAANRRDWGGKDYEDLMAGVDAMVARGLADPARLAVCGWSYGGFMTSTIVTKTDRFRAAVVGAGVTDLISMAGTCDIPDFNRSYFDSWPWEDPQFYVEHSAVLHAGAVKTPTLVVHGEKDERVPTSQGWEFYTALRKRSVPTDLLLLPRQPHGPREPRLLRTVQEWHLDWINRYTLGVAPVARRATRPAAGEKVAGETP